MIIIAGYIRTDTEKRGSAVEAFRSMVERARAYDGCLDFSISADPVDPSASISSNAGATRPRWTPGARSRRGRAKNLERSQ
jgi:hypothetical protein